MTTRFKLEDSISNLVKFFMPLLGHQTGAGKHVIEVWALMSGYP